MPQASPSLDEAVSTALKILWNSGWVGVAIGLGLVIFYALVKTYLKDVKPAAPDPPEIPDAECDWETDPEHPGGT